MAVYINRRTVNHRGVETIEECQTWQEANSLVREYSMADYAAHYYVSRRPTKAWREHQSMAIRLLSS